MTLDNTGDNFSVSKTLNYTNLSLNDNFNINPGYSLRYTSRSSHHSDISTQQYSSKTGYGGVNAAAAVAKAAGKDTFADTPNLGGDYWGVDTVKAPEAWANGYTGQGVIVAVLDTGVDHNHEDLKNNIWKNTKEIENNGVDDDGNGYVDDIYGWNFDSNNNNTLDKDGHGTHVSGTIAAEKNNKGLTGIAYDAKIMSVKVLDDEGSGSYDSIAGGIRYAVDNGAKVINMSLGGGASSKTLELAIEYASARGVIVVMAAGNSGGSSPINPASYANKYGVAVGAVDRDGSLANFSNRAGSNQLTYVTAPGVSIYSTLPNNNYASYSGTSMAAPHVAGVVALMLSANPNLSDGQVRQILAETSVSSSESNNPGFDFDDIFSGFNGYNFPFSNFGNETQQGYFGEKYTSGFGNENLKSSSSNWVVNSQLSRIQDENVSKTDTVSFDPNHNGSTSPSNGVSVVTPRLAPYWNQESGSSDYNIISMTNAADPLDPKEFMRRYEEAMAPYQDMFRFFNYSGS
ncbi:S8 family peptidase [Calothrix sp. PCC 6303]|uniref:S8 family peptidase n=1 Tax=Calothrix sp. PCC 6303 TaxID=1170562 RepID=UPI0002A00C42|nr:S8 family peptidase [Calothrix sp. PCC 6303]AFZ01829.1 Subtilisin [Calothrix sp. PCC 6303]